MLAGWTVLGRPIEADVFHGIFGRTAARPDAGLLFQKFGMAGGPEHFINRRWDVIVGKIMRVAPRHPFLGFRLGVMREIFG